MNITEAAIFVNGSEKTRIESEGLVKCGVEGQDDGREIDACRQTLTEAFREIHGSSDVDVLFPELGECIQ
jgi:hypothetical protein